MADYYTAASDPANDSDLDSSVIRAEWTALAAGFAKIAGYTGNGGKVLAINAGGTAMEALTTTGTGSGVRATSPTLVTPVLGVATATSINKITLTQPATGATLTLTDGKTLAATNTLTLSGTDGTTMTFPTTSATLARTDAANTFTGIQSMTSPDITTSITTPSTTFACFNTNATTVNAFGAASVALNIGHASAAAAFAGGISIPTGKNVTGTGTAQVTGFATVSATTLTGTLSTAAQPNITSVGTLTSLTSSGAISGTTVTATTGAFIGAAATLFSTGSTDSSDGSSLQISSAGAYGPTRGGGVQMYGNEFASIGGNVYIDSGDTATDGSINLRTGNNILGLKVARGAGGTAAGAVTIPNLAGTGTRAVVVDANGVLSAP